AQASRGRAAPERSFFGPRTKNKPHGQLALACCNRYSPLVGGNFQDFWCESEYRKARLFSFHGESSSGGSHPSRSDSQSGGSGQERFRFRLSNRAFERIDQVSP